MEASRRRLRRLALLVAAGLVCPAAVLGLVYVDEPGTVLRVVGWLMLVAAVMGVASVVLLLLGARREGRPPSQE